MNTAIESFKAERTIIKLDGAGNNIESIPETLNPSSSNEDLRENILPSYNSVS